MVSNVQPTKCGLDHISRITNRRLEDFAMKRYLLSLIIWVVLPFSVFCAEKEEPLLRVGILSDVHLLSKQTALDSVFRSVLEFYRAKGADAVILAGDFGRDAVEGEIAKVARIWYSVFPDNKGLDGRNVEKIFIYGNHEIDGHKYGAAQNRNSAEYLAEHNIPDHRAEYWEKYFHEPYQNIYRKDVKGYTFIAAHYVQKRETPGLQEFFDEQEPTLPPIDKPFFYIQHIHPRGAHPSVGDNGKSTKILSKYPNVIAVSGHTHNALSSERSIWQGAYTSIAAGSLKDVGMLKDRENGKVFTDKDYVSQMPTNRCPHAHQGLYMEVFEDRVEIDRYIFHHMEYLGKWIFPTDVTQRPYSYRERKAKYAEYPPVFAKRSKVYIERILGRDRKKKQLSQVKVSFPVSVSTNLTLRAFEYKVSAERQDADTTVTVVSKYVHSPYFYMSEKTDKQRGAECVFAEFELPYGVPFRFAVRPIDCFGNEGKPIYSKYFEL